MSNPLEQFGCMVFGNRTMQERLPREIYMRMRKTMEEGKSLDPSLAGVVANSMKDWAIEKGVTHYTHWFQPMTGITAEKHESFIAPSYEGGVIMEFSGKELVQGEPDASSFPSGGLRATFEARGYTAWDPTSYAFIKEGTLCIPTAFCSYGGHALDKKTPLLRSMEQLNKQALRVLRLLGDTETARVSATAGPEQEYFLIDKSMYERRLDLKLTGRTLFGAVPPKGQEMDAHYYGVIKTRVQAFMKELNSELWKLGILAKTEHNEAAPGQHELAPIFTTVNIAADHNQLTMEMMKKVAARHNLTCLLHEKPFAGVNGSGKHNNWSLCTDTGENIFDPGPDVSGNNRFLVFLAAVLAGADDYQDLLRISAASAGNDHRLGAHEAPPAILSVFLGEELTAAVYALIEGRDFHSAAKGVLKSGVHTMARPERDNTDRNRTSPFAFTGNKFEFRMPGSAFSVSGPNFILNTAMAEELDLIAGRMENGEAPLDIARDLLTSHCRIIFNGNNYCEEWVSEAKRRGLLNLKTTVDALPCFIADKNVALFQKHRIFTREEVYSRYEILMEHYSKTIHIEALTMIEMVRREILPAVIRYAAQTAEALTVKRTALPKLACQAESGLLEALSPLTDNLYERTMALENAVRLAHKARGGCAGKAALYAGGVTEAMDAVRETADALETLCGKDSWPFPTYGEILFSV